MLWIMSAIELGRIHGHVAGHRSFLTSDGTNTDAKNVSDQ